MSLTAPKTGDHWLTENVPSPLKVSHSRFNALRKNDLVARGYQVLTESPEAGVDIFAKQLRSHFIFFQGHPEYDALSLQREYLRDITRFIAGERDTYPAVPSGYFDIETEGRLACFQKRASAERRLPLSAELPGLRASSRYRGRGRTDRNVPELARISFRQHRSDVAARLTLGYRRLRPIHVGHSLGDDLEARLGDWPNQE